MPQNYGFQNQTQQSLDSLLAALQSMAQVFGQQRALAEQKQKQEEAAKQAQGFFTQPTTPTDIPSGIGGITYPNIQVPAGTPQPNISAMLSALFSTNQFSQQNARTALGVSDMFMPKRQIVNQEGGGLQVVTTPPFGGEPTFKELAPPRFKPTLPLGFSDLTPVKKAEESNRVLGTNYTEQDFTPQQTPTELRKYQDELDKMKRDNPTDPRIPTWEKRIKTISEGTMTGTGGFATLPTNTKDTWFETYRVSGKMPPFAYRDSASRNAFTSGYAEYLQRQGVTPTEAVTNKVEMDALGGSLKFQQKSYGMMGGFINNLNAQINRVKQISSDTIKRVGVRALDLPIRELNMRFIGSGHEKELQSYLMEISREIGKLSTGSQASIAELSVEAQKKWDSIHDPNLSLRELEIILNATKDQADLRRQSAIQELGTTKQRMQEITTGKKREEVDDPLGIRGK